MLNTGSLHGFTARTTACRQALARAFVPFALVPSQGSIQASALSTLGYTLGTSAYPNQQYYLESAFFSGSVRPPALRWPGNY